MRSLLALVFILLAIASAPTPAQGGFYQDMLEKCRAEVSILEPRLAALKDEATLIDNSIAILGRAMNAARDAGDNIQFYRMSSVWGNQVSWGNDLRSDISVLEWQLQGHKRDCDHWAKLVASVAPEPKPGPNTRADEQRFRTKANRIKRKFAVAERKVAENKRRLDEIRRRLAARGIQLPDTVSVRPRPGLGIELYGDLGGNFGLNAPRLDNFGQTLERGSGLYGGGGIVLLVPIPGDTPGLSGLHLRTGGQVLHSASEATRVNNDAGGFLRTRGRHNTTAAFGTLGFGLGPFDGTGALGRIRFTFDGGLGRAFHDVSVFGPGGNQVIRSNDSSFAWMLRGAAIYQVTDNVGIGAFVSHYRTDGVTAFLANGNPFALGGRTETIVGLTLVLRALRASSTYANVHTDLFPGGEIRGQIRFTPD